MQHREGRTVDIFSLIYTRAFCYGLSQGGFSATKFTPKADNITGLTKRTQLFPTSRVVASEFDTSSIIIILAAGNLIEIK